MRRISSKEVSRVQKRRNRALLDHASKSAIETLEDRVLLSTTTLVTNFTGWFLNADGNSQTDGVPVISSVNGGTNNDLEITSGNTLGGEGASAWNPNQVAYQNFTAHFTYTETAGANAPADGFTFALQDSTGGNNALGGAGGSMGYQGITPSFALDFNIYNGSHAGDNFNGGGNSNVVDTTTTGVNLTSHDPIDVTISYDGAKGNVYEKLQDKTTGALFENTFKGVNLDSILGQTPGSGVAYVGITGGDGGGQAQQDISDFTYSTSTTAPPAFGEIKGFGTQQTTAAATLNSGSSNPSGVPSLSADSNTLTLTTAAANEASSAFFPTADLYNNFTANFTYQDVSKGGANGFTFTLQDDPRAAAAIGGSGTDLGYSNAANASATAISPSVALEFNMSGGVSSISLATNGADTVSTTTSNTGSVNLGSGDKINASLNFNANELTVTLVDATTNATFTTTYTSVPIQNTLGNSTAYLGFTGSTGANDATQTISGLDFLPGSSVSPPAVNSINGFSGPLSTNGGVPTVSADGSTLTITTAANGEANSEFFNSPVTYKNFTANFTYQDVTKGGADGVAFVLQDDGRGVTALGGGGGNIGYSGISPSFAVQFNVYANSNTEATSGGAVNKNDNFRNTGTVDLTSGDKINVTLAYDTNENMLVETLTDPTANTSFQRIYTDVNLTNLLAVNGVASPSAFVGFTGGTGGANAQQEISNFSYTTSNTPPVIPSPNLPAGATTASGFAGEVFEAVGANPGGVPGVSADNATLTITDGHANEQSMAIDPTPVAYGDFNASFTYTEAAGTSGSPADGFGFALEAQPGLGQGGGQIAYGPSTPNSFAVEFNIYQNTSTAIGAGGTIDNPYLTGGNMNGVTLDSKDPIAINLKYSSSAQTLTETINDPGNGSTVAPASATITYNNVDLSRYLGNSQSAYIVFTGGTGGANAVQTINGFTYSADTTASVPQAGPQVNLAGYYQSYGIGVAGQATITTGDPNGDQFPVPGNGTNGYDGGSSQLVGSELGTSATVTADGNTQTFNFGPVASPTTPDVVDAVGQTINLPQGHYGNISLVGSAANGEQDNQVFTVNYTDGTQQSFSQNFSDWWAPATTQPGETIAVSMPDHLDGAGNLGQQGAGQNIDVYEYQFNTNPGKTVQSITLPMDSNVKILAMNVNAAPNVTGITPTSGPAAGGTTVTINGTGFTGATAVDFGATPATSYTVNAAGTQITAVDPAGTNGSVVDVTVTGPFGTSATSSADQFTYGSVVTPPWLKAGSAATWNSSTHTLTVTGAATIIADPGTDEPNIVASGSAAQLAITPATSPTDVHVGNISLSTGAGITVTSVASRSHSNHNVLVIGPAGAANDPTVSIDSTSKLDLGSNDLIVHTGTSDATGASELTAWRALAQTGRGVPAGSVLDGTWTGNGLTSSAAAATDKSAGYEETVLAVIRNNDQILGSDTKWTVGTASEAVGAKDIIVKYTYNGDAAMEGFVGDDSVTIVNGLYDGGKSSQPDWAFGDFTGSGGVNDDDITILNGLYGNGTASSGLPVL